MSNLRLTLVAMQSPRRLSPREAEVMDLAGLRLAEIALVLGISQNTVKTHLRSAYQKLSVETRAAAALAWQKRAA